MYSKQVLICNASSEKNKTKYLTYREAASLINWKRETYFFALYSCTTVDHPRQKKISKDYFFIWRIWSDQTCQNF